MIPPKLQSIIDILKIPKNPQTDAYDFTRLNDTNYYTFRHAFVEQKLFYETYKNVKNPKAIEEILNVFCMVLCGRVPRNVVTYKTDVLVPKIKLVPIPRGVEVEKRIIIEKEPPSDEFPDGQEIETVIEPNTNEKAVVRILVPTKKVPASELVEDKPSPRRSPEPKETPDRSTPADMERSQNDEDKKEEKPAEEEKKVDELVDVEEDQNDMGLSVPNRVVVSPSYSVYVIHQYAQRMHRNDFIAQIVRQLWDYFQENEKDQKRLEEIANKSA